MAKQSKKPNTEEQAWLDKIKAENEATKTNFPQMKQLAINTDMVDAEGNKIPVGTFNIRNEKDYSETVTFRPLAYYTKYIKSVKNGKVWKNENETIYVKNFETPYDSRGGIACGRLIGKAIPGSWTEAELKANAAKATCYCFMFGFVTFPGKEPVLVNFRASPAKARVIRDVMKNLDRNRLFDSTLTMTLKPVAGTVHPVLDITLNEDDVPENYTQIKPAYEEVEAFVKDANERIMATRAKIEEAQKANTLYKHVDTLAEDFKEDQIPF